jgi:SAM-dependent methyltransferase
MLTVDYRLLGVRPGDRLLDVGCGAGRHSLEAVRRGADVVALDLSHDDLARAHHGVAEYGHVDVPIPGAFLPVRGDARHIPFDDAGFDRVIASEVLEHIPDDEAAIAELVRVLKPGGVLAVTVPRWLPERICWALSEDYHTAPGGHVRIYTRAELEAKLKATGFQVGGHHHAHGLHAPYWWIKCAVGVNNDAHPLAKAYHQLLVWDIMKRPRATRLADRVLNPVIGKSVVVYFTKPDVPVSREQAHAAA